MKMDYNDKSKEELIAELDELRQTAEKLKMAEANYAAVFNAANDSILIADIETAQIIDVNQRTCQMHCCSKEELLKLTIFDLGADEPPYTREAAMELMRKVYTGEPQLFEWLAKDKAGRVFWVEVSLKRAIIGGKYRLLAVARDITERKEAQEALRESEERYRLYADHTPIHLGAIDKSGKFILWNRYSEKMFGYTREEAIGKLSPVDLHESKEEADEVIRVASEKGIYDKQINLRHKDGHLIPAHLVVVPYKNGNGNVSAFYGFAEDITEHKLNGQKVKSLNEELLKSNRRLKQLALKDIQTGLYNHHYLTEVIEPEFYRARRYAHPLSVVMLDIDYFKSINDVYGHEFGDVVLKQFAVQLKKMMRRYDIVIRLGGEEFLVISPGTERVRAILLAQRLLDAVNLYNFGIKERVVKLNLSIAVSSYPDDNITKGMDLINVADKIMNRAKADGGNRVYSLLDIKRTKPTLREERLDSTDVKFLKEKIEKLTRQGKQNLIESIYAFARTIELKDHYTGKHVESTVYYATETARALGLPVEEIENIKEASILHDLGKIGISDRILLKKKKLTKKEFEEIKRHPQIAADIIRPIQFMHDIIPLVLYHHERWDGKGYPAGLKGEEIPVGARIIAVADVYQALISNRPYRKAYPKKKAVRIIKDGSDTQFDPIIVKAFLKILKKENNGIASAAEAASQ